jgi:hypothetical protein
VRRLSETTKRKKSPTRKEGKLAADKISKKPEKIKVSSKAVSKKMVKRETKKKPKRAKIELEKHLTVAQEQAILTSFFRGEAVASVQSRYRKSLRDEIGNLKNAFEAGEFFFKDGIWQLVS